jgi:anaerobic glycerol-3-phosphate dehydrogenase
MAELSTDILDQAHDGKFTDFAQTVKAVLDQKVKTHPYIKDKKEELDNFSRIKDIFAQIDKRTYLDKEPEPKSSEE